MLENALSILILLIVLAPFYIQLGIYSLAYRVLIFEPPQTDIDNFVSNQLPMLRWLYKKSLDRLQRLKLSESPPTARGLMLQRWFAAIIPIAFVVAVILGTFSITNQIELIGVYIFYGIVFVISFYFAWNFGSKLKT